MLTQFANSWVKPRFDKCQNYWGNFCTCHGYSFTSVSAPPTILVCLLGCPQEQFAVVELLIETVVNGVGVDVVKDVVEESEKSIKS